MVRFLLSILVLTLFLSGVPILAALVLLFLLFRYVGFEVIIIGVLLDGYYAAFSSIPLYTLGAFLAWTLAIFLRRWLIVYNTDYASLS
jgi:hypothetical protein